MNFGGNEQSGEIMSVPTISEEKPKKMANKKTAAVEKKPTPAAIQAKSTTPESTSTRSKSEAPSSTIHKPSHEEVSLLAHRFFEQRGEQHGFHEHDWFQAEQELAEIS
jgi:hypothetical protein